MYRKIKSTVGRINPTNRLADTEDVNTPDETIDPEVWGSSATVGLGERLKQSGRTAATFGLLSVVILGILFAWARDLAVDIVTNPLLQGLAILAAIVIGSFWWGAKHQRQVITETDQLVLQMPEGANRFYGVYETAGDGTQVFMPYRGFDWLGFKSRPLTLRELGESLTRTFAKRHRNPEDPARIRVDDAVVETQSTAQGTVVTVNTDGLKLDEFGEYSDAYCQPPSQVSEENYRQLHQNLQTYTQQVVPMYEKELIGLRQENDDLRERLERSDEQAVDQFISRLGVATQAMQPRSRPSGGGGSDDESRSNGHDPAAKFEDITEALNS